MRRSILCAVVFTLACAPARHDTAPAPKPNIDPGAKNPPPVSVPPEAIAPTPAPAEDSVRRVAPPQVAYAHGWMPLSSTGVDKFLRAHPEYDGRGVLIGILDTGIDPSVPGLATTTTGSPKVLDVRDFSGEGTVALSRVAPAGDSVTVGGRRVGGFGRVTALNASGPYYAGTVAERPLGDPPAADLNRDGDVNDTLAVVVTRASDGWVLFADTDGDGSLAGEKAVHDYLTGRETFGWAPRGLKPRVALAANFTESSGQPALDLAFDTFGHGTHVSGIAAGHDMYEVSGFNGVAPGAQLLGLKIANGANGGISTTGSILRAMDYAVRFARERKLPLVLNMSFGVGNEIEGGARIDAIVDSDTREEPRRRHGDLHRQRRARTLHGSASRARPGLPSALPPLSRRASSSRGPTAPPCPTSSRTSARAAGKSPSPTSPHRAWHTVPCRSGMRATKSSRAPAWRLPTRADSRLCSCPGLSAGRKPVGSLAVKQALMVTATPTPGMTYLDEGTGLPDVGRAWQWLEGGHAVDAVRVRAVGPGDVSGALRRATPSPRDTVQTFELIRSPGAAPATYALRSDSPWLAAPASVTLKGERTRVEVRYAKSALSEPGARVGVVSGWAKDTLAGPAFRLVNAIAVASPVASGSQALRSAERVPTGGVLRTFFEADSVRPFALTISTGSQGERALAFLHEPDGMPFRDEAARPAGFDHQSAEYEADSRDVVGGAYEAVVVSLPGQSPTATVELTQSPVSLRVSRQGAEVRATLANLTKTEVSAEVGMHLGGAAREETVTATGSDPVRIPFVMPAWSRGVVIDITMDRGQWGRFTDFGLTLLDSIGGQLGKKPINYAFGRLQVEGDPGHADVPVTLTLLPGFADPADARPWTLHASIRLYADTSIVLASAGKAATIAIPAGKSITSSFSMPADPWPLGDKFVPLGLLVARVDGRSWTREAALPPSSTASVR